MRSAAQTESYPAASAPRAAPTRTELAALPEIGRNTPNFIRSPSSELLAGGTVFLTPGTLHAGPSPRVGPGTVGQVVRRELPDQEGSSTPQDVLSSSCESRRW